MPTVEEEDLRHRPDRCCVHRISADRPGDVDKDADLGNCLLLGRRVVASWLVDPGSERPKILVVLSPVPPVVAPSVATVRESDPVPRRVWLAAPEGAALVLNVVVLVGFVAVLVSLAVWGLR